jgi:crotonobetainyl-CoA:carnitine CoA-transferase CaiB-like acyl-CoA transferase
VEELQIPELQNDERFATNPMRVKNREELRRLIIERFKTRTAAEWEGRFKARSIPCSRILNVGDLVHNEQFQALQLLKDTPHPLVPDLRLLDLPVSQDKVKGNYRYSPPLLGEQTNEVLIELGYSEERIEELRKDGVVE